VIRHGISSVRRADTEKVNTRGMSVVFRVSPAAQPFNSYAVAPGKVRRSGYAGSSRPEDVWPQETGLKISRQYSFRSLSLF
jgi:hypothetical protein